MDPALSRSRVHCHACGHRGDTHFNPDDDDAPPPTCPSCSSEAVEILDHESSGYPLSLGMLIDHIVGRLVTPAARAGAQTEGPVPRAILDGLVEVKVREAGRSDRDDEPDAGEAFTVEGESACPVCHAGFHAGEGVVELPCLHAYHKACLQPWLARVATCPVCRARVVA